MNLTEPIKKIKIFMFIWFGSGVFSAVNFYKKYQMQQILHTFEKTTKNHKMYEEKVKDLNLFERNAFMYLNYFVIIIIIERVCDSYFKLWDEQDKTSLIEQRMEKDKKKN